MKRRARSRVGHDRWLVSYADFITLLFGFFVVMYAFAKTNHAQQVQVSRAIDTAFHDLGVLPGSLQCASAAAPETQSLNSVTGDEVRAPAAIQQDLDRIQRDLTQALSAQVAAHAVSIQMQRDGLVISLREAGFFNSASADPKPAALPTLRAIAARLGQEPYDIRVEGHTDNQPIHNAQFDSNWELSAARATRIARLFLQIGAIPPERLSAAGYGEFHPVASNSTPEGRATNRRVDLVVMPRTRFNFAQTPAADNGPWRRVTDGDNPATEEYFEDP
ncbi:MAG: OmpA family protein [Acidobacteriota bacterium]